MLPEPPVLSQSPCTGPLATPPPKPRSALELPPLQEEASLVELVDIGLRNHPLTRKAWADARSAAGALGQANAAWFPQVGITWTQNRTMPPNLPTQVPSPPYTTYSPQLVASYLIWDFGGRNATIENAFQTLLSSGWNYSWTMQSVMFQIIQSYYNFLNAKALLEAYQDSLNDAKVTLEATEVAYEAKVNTIVDLFQAKAGFYQAKLQLVQQQGVLFIAKATLSTAVGLPPDVCLNVAKPKKRSMYQICCDIHQIMQEAKMCRADLEGIKASIRAQQANVDIQFSQLLPNLQAQFTGGRTYFHNNGHDQMDYSESIILNIPIFTGFSTINAIKQAEAQVDSLIANYQNQELQALLTVLTNYYNVNTALETYENSREAYIYSKEAFDAVLEGYKSGNKMIVDLLQAQSTLSSARATFIQSEFNWYIAIANLSYSRGTLISNKGSDTTCMSLKQIIPQDIKNIKIEKIFEENKSNLHLKEYFQKLLLDQTDKVLSLIYPK